MLTFYFKTVSTIDVNLRLFIYYIAMITYKYYVNNTGKM